MKKILIGLLIIASLSSVAQEITPPRGIVTVRRLSAEGFYERSYGISAVKAYKNEDDSITLEIPYYTMGPYQKYLRARVSGNKICKALNLGKSLNKDKVKISGGAGSPWALLAEGRELECLDCKVKVISELTCSRL